MSCAVEREFGVSAIDRIAGVSPWSDHVRKAIELVSKRNASVLIMGPSGTGKELIARAIHSVGSRASGPFVPVDCAATTGTLFASHMFGHVKGSFTGAAASTLGCFRAAQGGTIFLDEIGEMELELQSKLLRVLQQRTVVPVGSHEEIPVDVRVVAATNRDLSAEVAERRFREDLFYRLNVVSIATMPLRDRLEDVPVLASRFLAELSVKHGMQACVLSPAAVELLQQHAWPGNVRELENVLERAVVFASGEVIEAEALRPLMATTGSPSDLASALAVGSHVAESHDRLSSTSIPGVFRVEPVRPLDSDMAPVMESGLNSRFASVSELTPPSGAEWLTLSEAEREHLQKTLAAANNNKSQAARMLGIDRSVLRRKLQRHGLGG